MPEENSFFLERSLILYKEKTFSYWHRCILSSEIILCKHFHIGIVV